MNNNNNRKIHLPAERRGSKAAGRVQADSDWVALLVDTSTTWGRQIVTGVVSFAKRHASWKLMVEARGIEEHFRVPARLNCGGVIARVNTQKVAEQLNTLKVPVVNVSSILLPGCDFPRVTNDMPRVAKLALEHFRDNGFKHFAYFGLRGLSYVRMQQGEFQELVRREGHQCHQFGIASHLGAEPDWSTDMRRVVDWLKTLPKPVGIFTWNASSAREVVYACLDAQILIPDEVAVLSGAEDDLLCEASPVSISAVVPATQMIGFRAAQMLNELRQGRTVSSAPVFIPPLHVASRHSTNARALSDPALTRALDYLRRSDPRHIRVSDLARQAGLGRRVLERRFREVLHRSPADEIRRARLDSARNLLAGTELAIPTVAEAVGFTTQSYFTSVFGRHFGMTPVQYRNQSRPR
jgi:LacI family transcriptional regulator